MKAVAFFAATDIVVVGQNFENADVSNPRGYEFGSAAYVYAEDAAGNRRRLFVASSRWEDEVLPKAEKLAAALTARLAAGKAPVGFARWEEARPAYGSAAYVAYGQDEDVALEAREEADERY